MKFLWKKSCCLNLTKTIQKGSSERGNVWKSIAESLNRMKEIYFKIDDRAVRDRFKVIEVIFYDKRSQNTIKIS